VSATAYNPIALSFLASVMQYSPLLRSHFRPSVSPSLTRVSSELTEDYLHHLTDDSCGSVVKTSSSAVAERPRDALCPSVVSLNKIINRAESFITLLRLITAHNVEASCHTLRRCFPPSTNSAAHQRLVL